MPLLALAALWPAALWAAPVAFNLPAQPADAALMAFCRQADVQLLFPFDELHGRTSTEVSGSLEPADALKRLLTGTGYEARRNAEGRFVVVRAAAEGSVSGALRMPDGSPARGAHVVISSLRRSAPCDADGRFVLAGLPPGTYTVVAAQSGFQVIEMAAVPVRAGANTSLETFTLKASANPAQLAPYVVQAESAIGAPLVGDEPVPEPRTAIGDLDRPRSETGGLAYIVFSRDQIARSGVVNLNQFLQRQILDSDATTLPPEQNASVASFASGSSNLNFGGFGADATIVLVDGRRLPEIVTALPANLTSASAPQPDVNVIPLNLIERIEVLPVSASALYSGSPVGGVINVVLRPAVNTTELTTTYTNSLGRFDAPQATAALLHGETLLGGRLRIRLDANFTSISPPTEGQLGFIRENVASRPTTFDELYRATPNVSSADGTGLFGPGTSPFTSVAPGAGGGGGLAAFGGRQGVLDLGLYRAPGGELADSPNSVDYPYGRRIRSDSFYVSATYDAFPWLQVGADASAGRTINNTGFSVFNGNLLLPGSSPFNPFGQAVDVTLNESVPVLGDSYDEAHIDYYSADVGLLFSLARGWQASLDAQYGLNVTRYRGIAGVDSARWQQLVDEGLYNPLRDTQAYAPPQAFADQAVEFYGGRGAFVTVGDYDTLDSALRITNSSLDLPTGTGGITIGGDYRYARLANYVDLLEYGDGSLVKAPDTWLGRSLQRVSGFGELEAPLLPARWLPAWVKAIDTDLAARYTASALQNEANLAPTAAVKVELPGGFALRSSYATSNRFPSPTFSTLQLGGISTSGAGAATSQQVFDPVLQKYETVTAADATNPNLLPEAAVTQTYGVLFERGTRNRFRARVDFEDTVTSGQDTYLDAQGVVDLESLFPQRVIRASLAPGASGPVGAITNVLTGNFSLAWRHSENWNASVDYTRSEFLGGTLEAYCSMIYFTRYSLETLPDTPPVDELRHPDGSVAGVLRQRANFGAGWSRGGYGFGVDGQYIHSRVLPASEWAAQGSDRVAPYTQFDAYLQSDLGRLLPWKSGHYGLRGQLRVDNLFGAGPPRYADDPSNAGVQNYGDWRGRIYSVSLTLTF
jgi:iron complex outermembrane receptor protein